MKTLMLLFLLLLSLTTQADLLDRVHLEDSIKTRVEETLHIADPNARAIVKFTFKVFQDELPGTQISSALELAPAKIETADIAKIEITAYTELDKFPEEVKNSLYGIVPFERSKVTLDIKKYPIPIRQLARIDSADIAKIAEDSVKSLSWILGFGLLIFFTASATLFVYISSRRMSSFKEQIQSLTNALTESAGPRAPSMPLAAAKAAAEQPISHSETTQVLHGLPTPALAELLADCYWTEQDGYAHWVWKNLLTSQQTDLYSAFEHMKEYALSFVNVTAVQMVFHEHPYYLRPNKLMTTSQTDLATMIDENLGRWHLISPLRQEYLPMDLSTKLKAVQNTSLEASWTPKKASAPRKLKSNIRWGQISLADEKAIFENPTLIPDVFKNDIPSLVWLAQKETEAISKILNQYDARSLAEAWVGPDEVLSKLEQSLPDKKLKLLQTYRHKTEASRASPVFMALVYEGQKNEAA